MSIKIIIEFKLFYIKLYFSKTSNSTGESIIKKRTKDISDSINPWLYYNTF